MQSMSGWKVHFWEGCQKSVKGTKSFCFPLLTQVIRGDSNSLQKVCSCFREEHYRLGCFELGKEQPRGSTITVPVGEEFERGTCDTRIALVSQVFHPFPDEVPHF